MDQDKRKIRNEERDLANDKLDWFSFENKVYFILIPFILKFDTKRICNLKPAKIIQNKNSRFISLKILI